MVFLTTFLCMIFWREVLLSWLSALIETHQNLDHHFDDDILVIACMNWRTTDGPDEFSLYNFINSSKTGKQNVFQFLCSVFCSSFIGWTEQSFLSFINKNDKFWFECSSNRWKYRWVIRQLKLFEFDEQMIICVFHPTDYITSAYELNIL